MFKKLVIISALFVMCSPELSARSANFLVWQPGGEGSPEQGQAALAILTDYIKEKGLKVKLKAIYLNGALGDKLSDHSAKKILYQHKPAIALLSDEIVQNIEELEFDKMAQSRPEPLGDGTIRYLLFKNRNASVIDPIHLSPIYLSEPHGQSYLNNQIFRGSMLQEKHGKTHYEKYILPVIKRVGSGSSSQKAGILLNSYEAKVLKKLETDWAKNLVSIFTSQPIKAPQVLLLKKWGRHFPHEELKKILLGMENDPQGKEVLQALRLTGFSEAP
jgi:hypothetical protein